MTYTKLIKGNEVHSPDVVNELGTFYIITLKHRSTDDREFVFVPENLFDMFMESAEGIVLKKVVDVAFVNVVN